jgi:adenylate kinase
MQEQINTIKNWLGSGSLNLFGVPFAGKDTQGRIIAELVGGVELSSGQLLRQAQDNTKLQEIMATGANVPSELFFEVVLPYLKSDELAGKPLILSGIGRKNLQEAHSLINVTNESGHPQKAVILLQLEEAEIWRRFEHAKLEADRGQRGDDNNPEVLQTRLIKFNQEIMPVINFYRENGMLVEVNGAQTREAVTAEIIAKLNQKAIS